MGTCKYCGKKAGFLRNAHSVCKKNHETGKFQMIRLLSLALEDELSLAEITEQVNQIAENNFVHKNEMHNIYALGFDRAIHRILEGGILSLKAEKRITKYINKFNLHVDQLNRHGSYSKFLMSITLRELSNGRLPEFNHQVISNNPFMFQKDEKLIWVFPNPVEYYEQTSKTSYQGGYTGMSFRMARGVYLRSGGFRGNPIKTTEITLVSKGYLALTSKHIYFASDIKSTRIPISKIISLENYEDGIGLQKDGIPSRPVIFKGLDGWFAYNAISYLSQI